MTRVSAASVLCPFAGASFAPRPWPLQPICRRPTALPEFVRHHCIDEIVVATMEDHGGSVWDLLECRTSGVKVIDFLTFWERETGRIDLDAIEPSWLVYSGGFRSSLLRRIAQRSLDMLVSVLGLVVMSPIDGDRRASDQAG